MGFFKGGQNWCPFCSKTNRLEDTVIFQYIALICAWTWTWTNQNKDEHLINQWEERTNHKQAKWPIRRQLCLRIIVGISYDITNKDVTNLNCFSQRRGKWCATVWGKKHLSTYKLKEIWFQFEWLFGGVRQYSNILFVHFSVCKRVILHMRNFAYSVPICACMCMHIHVCMHTCI